MSKDKTCRDCKYFNKGTDVADNNTAYLSPLNPDYLDTDNCEKSDYQVTKDSFCINDEYEEDV